MVWHQFRQVSSLVTSLSGKFVQFLSGHGGQYLRSVRSVQFIQFRSRTLPALLERSSIAGLERGLWQGPNFKEIPQFLKSNWISLSYGTTSNKEQTVKKVALFPCYIDEYVDYVPFSDVFGTWPSLAPWIRFRRSCPPS